MILDVLGRSAKPGRLASAARWGRRRLSASRRGLPNFVIIGAQKAGTTSLYSYLLRHPQVIAAFRKEVHFFDLKYARGPLWYRSHFPSVSELRERARATGAPAVCGEASPYYLFHPHSAERIARTVPDVKLIVLLRDPVARAYSHYRHSVRKGEETLPFEAALEREQQLIDSETRRMIDDEGYRSLPHQLFSYRSRGVYADQLETYWRFFPRNRLLIVRSEDLFADPVGLFPQILDFLGLGPFELNSTRAYNAGRYDRERIPLEEQLRAWFEPHNRRLYRLIGRDMGW